MESKIKSVDGAIFSVGHSYQPNRLGYCGPDENDILLEACQNEKRTERLVKALRGFAKTNAIAYAISAGFCGLIYPVLGRNEVSVRWGYVV